MELKLLNRSELKELYQKEMVYTFPKSELKPFSAMLRLLDAGCYEPLLALEEGKPVGYAMMWPTGEGKGALLEYLGIFADQRNGGKGSKLLDCLTQRYDPIIAEAEAPETEEKDDLRQRRLGFYLRNGFRLMDYECALFGVRFCCLSRGTEVDEAAIQAMHLGLYAGYFSPKHRKQYIQLPLLPGEEIHPAPEWVEETKEK